MAQDGDRLFYDRDRTASAAAAFRNQSEFMKRTVMKGFAIACLAAGMASVGSAAMAEPATSCTYDNEGAEEAVATQNSFTVYRRSQETWWPVRTCPINPRDGECHEH